MSSANGTWRLMIQLAAGTWSIHGAEEVMRSAFDEITSAITSVAGTFPPAITIHGYTNTADKADHSLTVLVPDVQGVDVCKMF